MIMKVSCHDYEGVMSVLCTPRQVKCYRYMISVTRLCYVTSVSKYFDISTCVYDVCVIKRNNNS